MVFQYTPIVLPLIFSIIVLIVVILTAFPRRHIPGVRSFIWLMLCVIEWTAFYVMELSTQNVRLQAGWAKFYFIGIVFAPLAWFTFSLEYSHMSKFLTRRNFLLLLSIPLFIIFLIWTNDFHHIIWSANIFRQTSRGLILDYADANAWGFWLIHTPYAYIFTLLGAFLLVRQSLKGPAAFSGQATVMITGVAFSLIVNVLYNFWLSRYIKVDLTPFAMAVSGVLYAWGLFRMGLFDLLPIAGEVVLEGLEEGIMVLDQSGQVVYVNPAFVHFTGIPIQEAMGATAAKMLARWPELIEEFRNVTSATAQISVKFEQDTTKHFEMRISPLLDFRRRNIGRVFIMRLIDNPAGTRALNLTSATARRKLLLMTMMANGEVVSINEHFTGVLGYGRADIIEKSAVKIWQSGEQRSTILRQIRREGLENMELALVAKDGTLVNLIVSAKSLPIQEETYLFFAMREKR